MKHICCKVGRSAPYLLSTQNIGGHQVARSINCHSTNQLSVSMSVCSLLMELHLLISRVGGWDGEYCNAATLVLNISIFQERESYMCLYCHILFV